MIKKGVSGGSRDVYSGADLSDVAWEAVVRRGLKEKTWIVQEAIHAIPIESLFFTRNGLEVFETTRLISPFMWKDQLLGIHSRSRLSDASLVIGRAGQRLATGASTVGIYRST